MPVTRTTLPTLASTGESGLGEDKNAPSNWTDLVSGTSDCRKPLLNLRAVTTPSVTTRLPACGDTAALPWIWAMVSAIGGSGGFGGAEPLLRGLGAPATKSVLLLPVSVTPLSLRRMAVLLLGAGAGAVSEQLALEPKPTKSGTLLPSGQEPLSRVWLRPVPPCRRSRTWRCRR